MAIWVSCTLRRTSVRGRVVDRVVRGVLGALGYSVAEVAVTFVGDGTMRRLNRRYRQKDRTTDVLAFAGREAAQPPASVVVLGDIVVSVPMARRQAIEAGHTVDREVTILIVHGLLHLCGYDHERGPREARRMFRKEREVVTKLGRLPKILAGASESRGRRGLV